jgi:hypothetical protein
VEIQNCVDAMENRMVVLSKIKTTIAQDPAIPCLGIYPKEVKMGLG